MHGALFGCMHALPNVVTIDLDASDEQLSALAGAIAEEFARRNGLATFFVPAEAAATRTETVKQLSAAGHEIGVLTTRKPSCSRPFCADFSGELTRARDTIERATGARVRGHRNAGFHVDYTSEWMYDVLLDAGFEHDSSRLPRRRQWPDETPVPRSVHTVRRWAGMLLEVPVSTADVMAGRVQLGTAGSVRSLPMPIWRGLVKQRQSKGEPIVLHVRASELLLKSAFSSSAPRRVDAGAIRKLGQLSSELGFTSIARAYPDYLRTAPIIES